VVPGTNESDRPDNSQFPIAGLACRLRLEPTSSLRNFSHLPDSGDFQNGHRSTQIYIDYNSKESVCEACPEGDDPLKSVTQINPPDSNHLDGDFNFPHNEHLRVPKGGAIIGSSSGRVAQLVRAHGSHP
jgi:hypothetical protein